MGKVCRDLGRSATQSGADVSNSLCGLTDVDDVADGLFAESLERETLVMCLDICKKYNVESSIHIMTILRRCKRPGIQDASPIPPLQQSINLLQTTRELQRIRQLSMSSQPIVHEVITPWLPRAYSPGLR